YGNRALVPNVESMTIDTMFDAASLTKVVATTPSIWLLIERGKIGLDDPAQKFIPEFPHAGITIRHLLTHTSGLRPDLDNDKPWRRAIDIESPSPRDSGERVAEGRVRGVDRIAPTEPGEHGVMLRGTVHDPTARRMGGVAGHAGLFTTAHDLALYARMLLNGGA